MAKYKEDIVINAKEYLRDKIAFPCSGNGICGKCKFKVNGNVSEITQEEKKFLTVEEIEDNIRLACYTEILGAVEIETLERKSDILGLDGSFYCESGSKSIVCAIDIGTTTIACIIYDANNQEILAEVLEENVQRSYGADVISRITVCTEKGVDLLFSLIKKQLERIYNKAVQMASDKVNCRKNADIIKITETVITGNTTMLHILEGLNPEKLGYSPFETTSLFGYDSAFLSAYLPKCVSAYVGADLLCAVLSSNMIKSDKVSILVDIGTNGEMAIYKEGKLICCSVAAGPAFEGWGLSCGSPAIEGAITGFDKIEKKYKIKFVGGSPSSNLSNGGGDASNELSSICGSGIIDLISILIDEEVIDESGAFNAENNNNLSLVVNANGEASPLGFLKNEDDEIRFYIGNTDVYISQKDVRQIQLAKAAISAGIYTLLNETKTDVSIVDSLYLCGGFGSHLDIDSSCNIGLIPSDLRDKVKVIGNAALAGALKISLGYEEVPDIYEEVNLSASREFMDYYVDCMMF